MICRLSSEGSNDVKYESIQEYLEDIEVVRHRYPKLEDHLESTVLARLRRCMSDGDHTGVELAYNEYIERFMGPVIRERDSMRTYKLSWPAVVDGEVNFARIDLRRVPTIQGFIDVADLDEFLLRTEHDPVSAALDALSQPTHRPPHLGHEMPDLPVEARGVDPSNRRKEPHPDQYPQSEMMRYHTDRIAWSNEQGALRTLRLYEEIKLEIEEELAAAQKRYDELLASAQRQNDADLASLRDLIGRAAQADPQAICELAQLCFTYSPYPDGFSRKLSAAYDPGRSLLAVEVEAPCLDVTGLFQTLTTKVKQVGGKALDRYQGQVLHAIPLRLMQELFSCEALSAVEMILINVAMEVIDRSTGQSQRLTVASIAAQRKEFASINVRNVDPKLCFRSLRGIAVPNLATIVPITPLLSFDADRRIVDAQPVIDGLRRSENLAAMEWEDFEHLVRELLEKEFMANSPGAEVKVTRASRDWGVDAIIFDPDPLRGGKYVVQAKRYTNTVDVAAVRDLYGTVVNEGANRGILVTTSGFGPDAYSFAKGKPISLLDGPNLLALFNRHGYDFKIDLAAARALRT